MYVVYRSSAGTRSDEETYPPMKNILVENILEKCLQPIVHEQKESQKQLTLMRMEIKRFGEILNERNVFNFREWVIVGIMLLVVQFIVQKWLLK